MGTPLPPGRSLGGDGPERPEGQGAGAEKEREREPVVAGPSGVKRCFRTVKSACKTAKRHRCERCGKNFNSPGKLSQHRLSHTGELPFGCQRCDKRFNSKFKLARHGLIHSDTRQFRCRHCDKTFHRKDHLSNHERTHDPVKTTYVCQRAQCDKRYSSPLSFRKHAALHSAEEGNLRCDMCHAVFERKEDVVHHLKVHAGSRTVKSETDKKFHCGQCGRRFFTAKDVRRHSVVHTGSRDFCCPHCSQRFGRKDHLVRHTKKAHPEAQVRVKPEPEPESEAFPDGLFSLALGGAGAELFEPEAVSAPAPAPSAGPTALPAFTQAFQNAAQSPKPPPRGDEYKCT